MKKKAMIFIALGIVASVTTFIITKLFVNKTDIPSKRSIYDEEPLGI